MTTNRPKSGKTTYHRDGTVTWWDLYVEQWIRVDHFTDQQWATMSEPEFSRIERHLARNGVQR